MSLDFYHKIVVNREELFNTTSFVRSNLYRLFVTNLRPETWSLYICICILSNCVAVESQTAKRCFRKGNFVTFPMNTWNISIYSSKTTNYFRKIELNQQINVYVAQYLKMLPCVTNLLSEKFVENILQRFLFHVNQPWCMQ